VLFPPTLHAYLDPGTGSLAVQAVVASIAAVAYAFRSYFGRLVSVFRRRSTGATSESQGRQN
jgi:hypothetical protein